MRIKLIAATIAGALACATLGAAVATASSGAPDKAEVAAPDPAGVVPAATAPNARAAALVRYDATFVRQKGFLKITHPDTGNYCLKLESTINEDTLVASITPEYNNSPHVNISAQWYSPHAGCPLKGNWVQVLTLVDGQTGLWSPADEAFSIVIP